MKQTKSLNLTYIISLMLVLIIVVWGLGFPASFEQAGLTAYNVLSNNFGWLYASAMTIFVVFVIWIGFFSKYKNIRLGPQDSKPEYSNISWFAMLFSAGMGIGLVFWGVAEPLNFYLAPLGVDPATPAAAQFAITRSFLHWGLHPWANYSVLALALAYMQFRKNKPGLVSSVFIPLFGEERMSGKLGMIIDILAVFATIAGVATSLGLGAYQINSGLNHLYGIPENNTVLVLIVVVVSIIFIGTAIMGLDKGIKFISNLNVGIAGVLMILVITIGPTVMILKTFVEGIGLYLQNLPSASLSNGAFGDTAWYGSWTIFYWAWWIAWAPFTATFIARISKGRTIKEFVTGVLLAPSLASFVWFSVFGALGINTGLEVVQEAVKSTSTALFVVLEQYPLGSFISVVVIILLSTFFITSANSATFVLGMMTSKGDLNPSNQKKLIWGVLQSLLALALMLGSSNGLQMLQTISIVAAFPFSIIMLAAIVSLLKVLKKDSSS